MNRQSRISWVMCCFVLGGLFAFEAGPLAPNVVAQQQRDEDQPRGEFRGGWRRFRREGASEVERARLLQSSREHGRGGNDRNDDNADRGESDGDEGQDRGRGGRNRQDRGRTNRDDENRGDEARNREDGDEENRDEGGRGRGGRRRGGRFGFDPAMFAERRFNQLDADGNQRLEGEELEGLRGPMAEADLNDDKVITLDELVERLSNRDSSNRDNDQGQQNGAVSKGTAAAAGEQAKAQRVYLGSAGGAAEPKEGEEASARRTYRFTPARESLPTGLPTWFRMRDRNGDGQVAMSEYSRVWSRRMVNEFLDIDLNNDGVITPKEAQAAE